MTDIVTPRGDVIRVRTCESPEFEDRGCIVIEFFLKLNGKSINFDNDAESAIHLPFEVVPEMIAAMTKARNEL